MAGYIYCDHCGEQITGNLVEVGATKPAATFGDCFHYHAEGDDSCYQRVMQGLKDRRAWAQGDLSVPGLEWRLMPIEKGNENEGERDQIGEGGVTTCMKTTSRREQVLQLVREHPGISIPQMAETLHVKANHLYRELGSAQHEGQIVKLDRGWFPA